MNVEKPWRASCRAVRYSLKLSQLPARLVPEKRSKHRHQNQHLCTTYINIVNCMCFILGILNVSMPNMGYSKAYNMMLEFA